MNRFLSKILVLLSLTVVSLSLMGQDYTPMDLSEGATWSHNECGFKPDWGAVYKFKIIGDTVIHAETYKKLYFQSRMGAGICSTCNFTFNRDSATLFAFIRQSIPKRKVFFICPSISNKEWLGYDFDISNVGQTVTGFSLIFTVQPEGPIAGIYVYQLIVDAIDSVCVNGEYVRRYYYGPGNGGNIYHLPEYWVEGIGSSLGLMVQGFGGPDWIHSLYCFHNKDGSVYYDYDAILDCIDNTSLTCEEGYDCSPYTSVDPGDSESVINIYPNPATDKIFIESKSLSGTLTLTLFNMMGQKNLTKIVSGANELESIDINELTPGFYYLLVETDGFMTGRKIIKE